MELYREGKDWDAGIRAHPTLAAHVKLGRGLRRALRRARDRAVSTLERWCVRGGQPVASIGPRRGRVAFGTGDMSRLRSTRRRGGLRAELDPGYSLVAGRAAHLGHARRGGRSYIELPSTRLPPEEERRDARWGQLPADRLIWSSAVLVRRLDELRQTQRDSARPLRMATSPCLSPASNSRRRVADVAEPAPCRRRWTGDPIVEASFLSGYGLLSRS